MLPARNILFKKNRRIGKTRGKRDYVQTKAIILSTAIFKTAVVRASVKFTAI